MAKVKIYNLSGEASGELELKDSVFAVKPKAAVVHQVYVALSNNAREPWAHSKTRGEVRGGGRKPWRQKGTGRARHGSIRSPLWRGGGVTFGPLKTRNYKQKINKKMNQLATRMVLSDKLSAEKLLVLEALPDDGKAKTLANLCRVLPVKNYTAIILTAGTDENLIKAARNLKKIDIRPALDANVAELLRSQFVLISRPGLKVLETRLARQ